MDANLEPIAKLDKSLVNFSRTTEDECAKSPEGRKKILRARKNIADEFVMGVLSKAVYDRFSPVFVFMGFETHWEYDFPKDDPCSFEDKNAWFGLVFYPEDEDDIQDDSSHKPLFRISFDFGKAMTDKEYRQKVIDAVTCDEIRVHLKNAYAAWIKAHNDFYSYYLGMLEADCPDDFDKESPVNPGREPGNSFLGESLDIII